MKTAEIKVELLDSMGDDLTVVDAARVSFDKQSGYVKDERGYWNKISEKDQKLIKYLARNNHWSPFGHVQATFRIKAPIFVARQVGKHQVGLVWNEVSRRYVDSEPEFYLPNLRKRAENVKQGSSKEILTGDEAKAAALMFTHSMIAAMHTYNSLLRRGVAPEQARMFLPQNMMTEWVWTGSLAAFARVVNLRLDPHAQQECQEVARAIDLLLRDVAPHSWSALTKGENE
jgi:thymidylate synthase (FAD)